MGDFAMRRLLIFCIGLLLVSSGTAMPVHAGSYDDSFRAYRRGLHEYCPKKRLELLSPAGLEGETEDFYRSLSPSVQKRIDHIISRSRPGRCSTIGAWCAALDNIEGFYVTGHMVDFTKLVCASHGRCTSLSECPRTDGRVGP
jgi:hypothetical protein